jgi:DNA (cytosine-5)-methyltransferase 1
VSGELVLSIFPGIDLLGRAFELEGFVVVTGPDLLFGRDVREFHPPAGVFGGVIGGPPCQAHSRLANLVRHVYGPDRVAEDLIPEYQRCVTEAKPTWWLMEQVPAAPLPVVAGYRVDPALTNNRLFGGAQHRVRRISFGTRDGRRLPLEEQYRPAPAAEWHDTVTANGTVWGTKGIWSNKSREHLVHAIEAQGLPAEWLDRLRTWCTIKGAIKLVGNGVPLPMGRAIARSVRAAMED